MKTRRDLPGFLGGTEMRGNPTAWRRLGAIILMAAVLLLPGGTVWGADGDVLGTPQHTWAPGHASNPGTTLYMKWASTVSHNGAAVTICDSNWTSLNGTHGYIADQSYQRIYIWKNADNTGVIAPTSTEFDTIYNGTTKGYLQGANGGKLLEGHVTCGPPPSCGDGAGECTGRAVRPTGAQLHCQLPVDHPATGRAAASLGSGACKQSNRDHADEMGLQGTRGRMHATSRPCGDAV